MNTPEDKDIQDELRAFRHRFVINDHSPIYLDGNSLGRLPKNTRANLIETIDQWGTDLIAGWNQGWIDSPQRAGAAIAEVIGATPSECLVADSTSVNLFKLVVAVLKETEKTEIVTDDMNFPSDIYILRSAIDLLGNRHKLRIVRSHDQVHGPVDDIVSMVSDQTALVALSHVAFKSGYLYDMDLLTREVHRKGSAILWDVSHSVGAVPMNLRACQADLAVGCTYKYLNAGPGASAFMYVRQELQDRLANPVQGWMGEANQFRFQLDYTPRPGISQFLTGTPPILAQIAIESGVSMIAEAGIDKIRRKSIALSELFMDLWEKRLQPLGFSLRSPRNSALRGSHITLGHPESLRIDRALIDLKKVVPDFRTPDNLRFGFAPLYTTFCEVSDAVDHIESIVQSGRYRSYSDVVDRVT